MEKKRKIDNDFNIDWLFIEYQMVNVEYSIEFVTHFSDYDHKYTKSGFLRDVLRDKVENRLQVISQDYVRRQAYPTEQVKVQYQVQPVPMEAVDLLDERMYGAVVNYHYLEIEPNLSEENTCVYDFLISNYKPYIKSLTFGTLTHLFDEEDQYSGVSTRQVEAFCIAYNSSLYALDLEMKMFHRYIPDKRSHKLPALVFVVANKHMYPIVNDALRKTLFAVERLKESSFCYRRNGKRAKALTFDNKRETILNPAFEQISSLSNVNVIFTDVETLLPLVIHLFQQESTIYETNGYGGNILQIRYRNNVHIEINRDYDEALGNCTSLGLFFKNQNLIHLVNKAFEVFRQTDKVKSTFNRVAHDVFFNYVKSPFDYTFAVPSPNANLKAFGIQKCHSACLST
jgi:hypothetical protein